MNMNLRDQKDNFTLTGPVHLTSVAADWGNSGYRRSVAASLVKGVYVLQRDRHNRRTGDKAQAPAWWKSFNFECKQELIDKSDSSIFGAMFEYKPYISGNNFNNGYVPPRYVIAFRGTILENSTARQDIYLGSNVMLNGLTRTSRYQIAVQVVRTVTTMTDYQSVWLTGHSLGASIALLVGKNLAKFGAFIPTFVFNPPFPSAPIDKMVKDPSLRTGIRFTKSVFTAGLAMAMQGNANKKTTLSKQEEESFSRLCNWVPNLFVNPNDPICCEYIGYFEHRMKMAKMGVGGIERIASRNSIICLVSGALGTSDGDAHHLIPSALITKNVDPLLCKDFKRAHSVAQWWSTSPPNYQHRVYNWCNDY